MSVTVSANNAGDLEVNMSNGNAARVFDSLGISLEPDWCGELPASDFLGRVLVAQALSPVDEGMPAYEHLREPGQCHMIEAARRPGYLQERLGQLHELASWAIDHGVEVYWG
jgi:hypothetical protein